MHRHWQNIQRDKETKRQRDKETKRQRDKETKRQIEKHEQTLVQNWKKKEIEKKKARVERTIFSWRVIFFFSLYLRVRCDCMSQTCQFAVHFILSQENTFYHKRTHSMGEVWLYVTDLSICCVFGPRSRLNVFSRDRMCALVIECVLYIQLSVSFDWGLVCFRSRPLLMSVGLFWCQ